MKFDGAIITEQGITFAIIVVKPTVLGVENQREKVRKEYSKYFPDMSIILMAQDGRGVPSYQGKADIVKFLSKVDPRRIPWKTYSRN